MSRFSNPLSHVRVASPCPADWDSMIGDERVRFCGQCELNVYNLSAMTKTQAENLIAGTERRLCVRFYRREDGSIITQDCPVGLRAFRRRMSKIRRAAVAAILGFFAGAGGTVALNRAENILTGSSSRWPQRTMGMIAEPVEPIVRRPDAGQLELQPPVSRGRSLLSRPRQRR